MATGSHLDSQPTGGRLDGALGVCAGLEAVAAMADAKVTPPRALEVAAWMNEEGSRFRPGTMGSAAFVEPSSMPAFRRVVDADGVTVAEALAALGDAERSVPLRALQEPYHSFVELHIEQGPILEQTGVPIGIATGAQATRWYEVEVQGVAAHAGTTPRSQRRDAMERFVAMLTDLFGLARTTGDELRLTVGRLTAQPGTVNTVPEWVMFTVDARHPDDEVLERVECRLHELAADVGGVVGPTLALPSMRFASQVRGALARAAALLGLASRELVSGAFHDSVNVARHCPTGLLFVPSIRGVSHHPSEATHPSDLAAGARALAAALVLLAYPRSSGGTP